MSREFLKFILTILGVSIPVKPLPLNRLLPEIIETTDLPKKKYRYNNIITHGFELSFTNLKNM